MNAIFMPHHNGSRPHLAHEAGPYNKNKNKTKQTIYFTTLIFVRVHDATGLGAMGNQL